MVKSSIVINKDIFLKSMIKSVEDFYVTHYVGDYIDLKAFHIQTLIDNYNYEYFQTGNLYDKKIEFLSHIQNIVNKEFCNNFL